MASSHWLPSLIVLVSLRIGFAQQSPAPLRRLPGARKCDGYDEEYGLCDKPACDQCVPEDCVFSEWSSWHCYGGCSGLQVRTRDIKKANNDCGAPCSGPKEETRAHIKEECKTKDVDCKLSDWGSWSKCASPNDQRFRTREIEVEPKFGGRACSEALHETGPCGVSRPPLDCVFAAWQEWTSCSATCGEGRYSRQRRMDTPAMFGGKACTGPTLMTAVCEDHKCVVSDCVLSEWTAWSVCNEEHPQKFRSRSVKHPASGGGAPCNGTLRETASCPMPNAEDCVYSEWDNWRKCDADCDGGQTFRKRRLEKPASNGGSCTGETTEMTKPCNEQPCKTPPKACVFSDWEAWGPCDVDCGNGSSTRIRSIDNLAEEGGAGCLGPLEERRPCENEKACVDVDCKWGEWEDWSGCTCACDGGTKRRNRVVVRAPLGKGSLCSPLDKSEVAPCNTEPCKDECKDGLWDEWGAWSDCSASCDGGYRSRHRGVKQLPTSCGKPLEGLSDDFASCEGSPPCVADVDCALSEWGEWSDCSCSCDGLRERTRVISAFVAGRGKPCTGESMKEIQSCNPLPGTDEPVECGLDPKRNCKWDRWEAWSECSRTCGGGQHTKKREIAVAASGGGTPCEGPKEMIGACNEDPCEEQTCIDCKLSDWGEWGQCSSQQRIRHRSIAEMPNACGRLCDETALMQMQNCTGAAKEVLVCSFSGWSEGTGCSHGCGPLSSTRNRALGFKRMSAEDAASVDNALFVGDSSSICSGMQVNLQDCAREPCTPACEPRHCEWGAWSNWGPPSCDGLCKRTRTIKTHSNECGKGCEGPIIATKNCNTKCDHPVACEFGSWGDWSPCTTGYGQKKRTRPISQEAQNGGTACSGPVVETIPCSRPPETKDCAMSSWADWDACPVSCGGGTQHRKREIVQAATAGGQLCSGDLEEFQVCGTGSCITAKKDCELSEWSEFSGCEGDGQRYRDRHIVHAAIGDGKPCAGHLEETETCIEERRDCVMSDWTKWGECDKTCGGGQHHRTRQIQVFTKLGGKECDPSLIETKGCNEGPCSYKDCEVTEWSDWDACSSSCGVGQRSRTRRFKHMRGDGGEGCETDLSETVGCNDKACVKVDCAWGDWKEWETCSMTCNGGVRSRKRDVDTYLKGGGAPCAVNARQEVEPCNTQACARHCVDGAWEEWSKWSGCSSTCGGGVTFRSRKVKTMANSCGSPAAGMDYEQHFCNVDVQCEEPIDCVLKSWGEWSDCSQTCDGIMTRSRDVEKYGRGNGTFCDGALKEVSSCHPLPDEPAPDGCGAGKPKDCTFSEWSEWSTCSKDQADPPPSNLEDFADYSLCNKKYDSNLGGKGPDNGPEELRYYSVLPGVDLVVTAISDYKPKKPSVNGLTGPKNVDSCFGVINMAAGLAGGGINSVKLKYKFVKTGTNTPKTMERFYFSWFDIDGCRWTEEMVTFHGAKQTYLFSDHELEASRGAVDGDVVVKEHFRSGSILGTGADNPRDPRNLTDLQKSRAVTVLYEDVSEWTTDIAVKGGGKGNRNFAFAGFSELVPTPTECGRGMRERHREITNQACHGGAACQGSLHEMQECHRDDCSAKAKRQDCEIGEWEDWSPCKKCGRLRRRHRRILQLPRHGGKPCVAEDLREISTCTVGCEDETVCAFGAWEEWGECAASCGRSSRKRKRKLKVDKKPAEAPASMSEVMAEYEALKLHTRHLQGGHMTELALAFASGGLVLMLGLGAWRFFTSMRFTSGPGHGAGTVGIYEHPEGLQEFELPLTGRQT